MKVSFITTVYNEEDNIVSFLKSVLNQSSIPDEIIIVDGGSTDSTLEKINQLTRLKSYKNINVKLIVKKGNRSIGRNEAIKIAQNEIIAISDAGNILDRKWLENITKPFGNKKIDVVAGYYKGIAKNIFQKCLIPFVLVMPDKASVAEEFLPATRSMAIKKSIWKKAGEFDEKLSHNEDYAFANKLKSLNVNFAFAKNAIVNWIPRQTFKSAFIMFFRFALGDIEAGLIRDKVIYIYLRYLFTLYLLILGFIMKSYLLWGVYGSLIILYLGWAIWKNYKYVLNYKAIIYLFLFQILSDMAVLSGSCLGLLKKISIVKIKDIIYTNKGITIIVACYIITMFSVISWGIPNLNHPFTYHMDEWHQVQSIRSLFKVGTSNIPGAANGSILHFFITGLYLVPFSIFKIIDPFAIKSSVLNLNLQNTLFVILRLNTIIYGSLSIIVINYICKKFIKINSLLIAILFTINPLWLFLGNYFKYDIALIFWMLISILFLFEYIYKPKQIYFILFCIFSGLAFSIKISAVALLPIIILAFIIFQSNRLKNVKLILSGLIIYLITIIFFGLPDLIFSKGNILEYLSLNLVRDPNSISNFNINHSAIYYLIFRQFPYIFGFGLIFLAYLAGSISFLRIIFLFMSKKLSDFKQEVFIYIVLFLLFIPSISFGLGGGGNRALILLPIFLLNIAFVLKLIIKTNKILTFFLIGIILIQVFQSYAWISIKYKPDPRETSSKWIVKNIPKGSEIGIENIPIYQEIPDFILKDFYLKKYKYASNTYYNYQIVSSETVKLPKYIILTNDEAYLKYINKSSKNDLINNINTARYIKIKSFYPELNYFDLFADRFTFMLMYPIPSTISIYER